MWLEPVKVTMLAVVVVPFVWTSSMLLMFCPWLVLSLAVFDFS